MERIGDEAFWTDRAAKDHFDSLCRDYETVTDSRWHKVDEIEDAREQAVQRVESDHPFITPSYVVGDAPLSSQTCVYRELDHVFALIDEAMEARGQKKVEEKFLGWPGQGRYSASEYRGEVTVRAGTNTVATLRASISVRNTLSEVKERAKKNAYTVNWHIKKYFGSLTGPGVVLLADLEALVRKARRLLSSISVYKKCQSERRALSNTLAELERMITTASVEKADGPET